MTSLQIVSLAIFAIGIWSFLQTWQAKRGYRDSRFWPTAKGQIIDSDLAVETIPGSYGSPVTFYSAAVRYRFQVGHRLFESTRISLSDNPKSTNSARHRALVARYPVGRIVQVHYDPRQPGVAMLEAATKVPLRLRWLLSVGFLVLGTAGVIAAAAHP